jgi:hypothetical protein
MQKVCTPGRRATNSLVRLTLETKQGNKKEDSKRTGEKRESAVSEAER